MYGFLTSPIGQNELLEIKELKESGYIENIYNAITMTADDVDILKRLVLAAKEHNLLDNLISICKLRYPFGTAIYVSVKEFKLVKPIVDNFKDITVSESVNFVERVNLSVLKKYKDWSIDFCTPEHKKEKSVCKATINGIKIGNMTIDNISIEAEDSNIIESIRTTIDDLMNKYKQYEDDKMKEALNMNNRAIVLDDDMMRELRRANIRNSVASKSKKGIDDSYTDNRIMHFICQSFYGFTITQLSFHKPNMTGPVMKLLPELKPTLKQFIDCTESSIIITNTGTLFLSNRLHNIMMYMKDGKLYTENTEPHIIYLLKNDDNIKQLAIELKLHA